MNNEIFMTIAQRAQWCWLCTITDSGYPNVSPKNCFIVLNEKKVIIGNVASPYAEDNLRKNSHVCVAFIDVFSKIGYKLVGTGQVIDESYPNYQQYKKDLNHLMVSINIGQNGFNPVSPIKNIFLVDVESVRVLEAPKLWVCT